jgi:hypothetical protein
MSNANRLLPVTLVFAGLWRFYSWIESRSRVQKTTGVWHLQNKPLMLAGSCK